MVKSLGLKGVFIAIVNLHTIVMNEIHLMVKKG